MSERYKTSFKWTSHLSNVLFLDVVGGTFDKNNVKEDRDSGFICINSRNMWDEINDPYVLPQHFNQVLFYPYVLDIDWYLILRHTPRSKHIFENHSVSMATKKDSKGDDNGEWYVHALFNHLQIDISFS